MHAENVRHTQVNLGPQSIEHLVHASETIRTCSFLSAGELPTFDGSQALLLHLKHGLYDQGGTHSLQDETQRKGKGWRHAKDGHGYGSVKEGLDNARHQQEAHG